MREILAHLRALLALLIAAILIGLRTRSPGCRCGGPTALFRLNWVTPAGSTQPAANHQCLPVDSFDAAGAKGVRKAHYIGKISAFFTF